MSPHLLSHRLPPRFSSIPSHDTTWPAGILDIESIHLSEKRFKKGARFLPNAHQKQNGKKIARNFYRFSILPLQIDSWWHQAISPKVITLFSGRDISHTMKHKNEDDRFAPASSFLCKADKLPYESRYHYL